MILVHNNSVYLHFWKNGQSSTKRNLTFESLIAELQSERIKTGILYKSD